MASAGDKLLLFGKNSFIANYLLRALPQDKVVARSHGDLDAADLLDDIGLVINCARHPFSSQDDYDIARLDPDLTLAKRIGDQELPFIMLSSRKVYTPSDQPLREDMPLGPSDAYGRNKLKVEEQLREILGERLTILRLANIFGDERVPGRRSFLAMALTRLAEQQEIRYDMSPFVERDFLPVEILSSVLARVVQEPPGGIMNIGSGISLPTGHIALWIMEGYGGGHLLVDSHEEKDRFVLDISRQKERFGTPCSMVDLRDCCLKLGQLVRSGT